MFRRFGFLAAVCLVLTFGFDPTIVTMLEDGVIGVPTGNQNHSTPPDRNLTPNEDGVIGVPTGHP